MKKTGVVVTKVRLTEFATLFRLKKPGDKRAHMTAFINMGCQVGKTLAEAIKQAVVELTQ